MEWIFGASDHHKKQEPTLPSAPALDLGFTFDLRTEKNLLGLLGGDDAFFAQELGVEAGLADRRGDLVGAFRTGGFGGCCCVFEVFLA